MPTLDFSQQLMEAKRKANLRGRPLSQREIEAITSGVAEGAHMRNVTGEQLDLQTESLAEIKRMNTAQIAAADKARKQQIHADKQGMWLGAGAMVLGEPLAAAGSAAVDFGSDFIQTILQPNVDLGDFFEAYFGW